MLRVISLGDIFVLRPPREEGGLSRILGSWATTWSPPPFGFPSGDLSWGGSTNRQVCGPAGGRSKKKLAPSPLSCRARSEMIRPLARPTNSSPHPTFLTDLSSSKGCPLPLPSTPHKSSPSLRAGVCECTDWNRERWSRDSAGTRS